MKRFTWFATGVAAGVAGTTFAKKRVKAAVAELSPANLAHKAVDRVKEAAAEGKEALKAKVVELRERIASDSAEGAEPAEVIELDRRRA